MTDDEELIVESLLHGTIMRPPASPQTYILADDELFLDVEEKR
jgi:hypothetical protein